MTTVVPVADLAIVSDDRRARRRSPLRRSVTITIIAANNGPSAALGATVTDTLPPGLDIRLGDRGLGTVTAVGGVVTANSATFLSGGSRW